MEVGKEAASKDLLSSAPTLRTGRAPGSHIASTAEVCFEEWGKGEESPTPTASGVSSGSPATGELQVLLCRLCDFGNILSGSPFPHLKWHHLMGLWGKAEEWCQEAILPGTW